MKRRLILSIFVGLYCNAIFCQPSNWQNLDLKTDGVFGISTEKAYSSFLKNKKPQTVIVAVIDSGIDTSHEDLRSVLWTNPAEIPGNGIDDDHNGYIDDVHGWNFSGIDITRDSLAKIIREYKSFYDSLSYVGVPPNFRRGYQEYRKLWAEYQEFDQKLRGAIRQISEFSIIMDSLTALTGKNNPSIMDFEKLNVKDSISRNIVNTIIGQLPFYTDYYEFKNESTVQLKKQLAYAIAHFLDAKDSAGITASFIESNANISYDKVFAVPTGNDLENYQPLTAHGTHVAGIISANRCNNIGMKGVADCVRIMPIKICSPLSSHFDERGLANAIKYAVNNGARIINLSFMMPPGPNKSVVDAAVKYAMGKDVLIVHSCGNSGSNTDQTNPGGLLPSKYYSDGTGEAQAWINVGASGWKDDENLPASFSNFGIESVDIFAPGEEIYSSIPGSRYKSYSGTSMATPVVAGVAALIMGYYPKLSALQVKDIILQSVVQANHLVRIPGNISPAIILPFSTICKSGGVVNAYNALQLAEKTK